MIWFFGNPTPVHADAMFDPAQPDTFLVPVTREEVVRILAGSFQPV